MYKHSDESISLRIWRNKWVRISEGQQLAAVFACGFAAVTIIHMLRMMG